jgi:hypothetical protein
MIRKKLGTIITLMIVITLILTTYSCAVTPLGNNTRKTDLDTNMILDGSLIVKPKVGYLYVHDREVVNLGGRVTVIIGKITIIAASRNHLDIDKIEFWIDRELKNSDTRPPYQWTWNERTSGWHTIRVKANKNERTLTDDLTAFIYNIGRS